MNTGKICKAIWKAGLLAGVMTALFGCSQNLPVNPEAAPAPGQTVRSDRGEIRLLPADPAKVAAVTRPVAALHKETLDSSLFYMKMFIEAGHRAELKFGDKDLNGQSKVKFDDTSLPDDMTVFFEWAGGQSYTGEVNSLTPGTENLAFGKPAEIELSYQQAELSEVNEDSIGLYMYNADTDSWEALPVEVKTDKKSIKGKISRFGKLALFYQKDGALIDLDKIGVFVFQKKRRIKANKGGTIVVGNREMGKSYLRFPKGALPEDMTIDFQWVPGGTNLDGMLNDMVFGPHGTDFNVPVEVTLSYKMAELTGIDENNLKVYYLNEETGMWEYIGGQVDTRNKKVTVYLNHFSRYALSAD